MLELLNKGRIVRFAPDDGGKSGGSNASGGSPASTVDVEALFKDIPLDELDTKTQQLLGTIKKTIGDGFATLQKSVTDKESSIANITKQARDFQSQKDRLEDQLRIVTGGKDPVKDDYLKAAEDVLRGQKYNDEQIAQHAPVFAELLKSHTRMLKAELGKDLGPMASQVAFQAAKTAFEAAQQMDDIGVLQIPEVAEKVWKDAQDHTSKGGPINPDFVLNLAKIQYFNIAKELRAAGKEVPNLVSADNGTANMNTGGGAFTFPGAGRVGGGTRSIATLQKDPKAAKNELNADTDAALRMTFRNMGRDTGVYPEAYKTAK